MSFWGCCVLEIGSDFMISIQICHDLMAYLIFSCIIIWSMCTYKIQGKFNHKQCPMWLLPFVWNVYHYHWWTHGPYHMNRLQAFMPFCITYSRFNVPRESIQVAKPNWNPQVPVAKGQGVRFCVCVCVLYLLWTPSTWLRDPEYTVPKDHREPEFLKSHKPWVLIVSLMLFLVEMNSNTKFFKIFGMGNWYAFFFIAILWAANSIIFLIMEKQTVSHLWESMPTFT